MLLRFCEWLQHNSWIVAIHSSVLMSVIIEVAHYTGFFLLVGSIVTVDLRLLGVAGRRQSATQLAERFFPLMWTGLAVAVLTGFIMLAGDATAYLPNPVFHVKVSVILLAVVFGVIIQWNVPLWDQLPDPPTEAKLIAFVSLLLWIGAILAAVEVPALTGVG